MTEKQKKYSRDFSFYLAEQVKAGELISSYLNKDFFNAPELKDKEEILECNFDRIDNGICSRMLVADSEFEQGKVLFEALKHLNLREASDIGFWNFLAHNDLYRYIHYRWPGLENPPKGSSRQNYILNHWIMPASSQNNLIDYTLSGLWWSFYISKDDSRNDPYELTKILFVNQQFRTKGFGQAKFARHKPAVLGILEFIKENQLHLNNFEENGSAITPFINLIGGTKPLSFFDKEWYKTQLKLKFSSDIETYGRLFRRDQKPSKLLVKTTSKPTTKDSSVNDRVDAEEKKQTTKENLTKDIFFAVSEDGALIKTTAASQQTDFKFSIKVVETKNKGYLFLCFADGNAVKVPMVSIIEMPEDQKFYLNGYKSYDIKKIEIIDADALLFLTFQHQEIQELKLAKGYKTAWIVESDLSDPNFHLITEYTKDLKIEILPLELEEGLSKILKIKANDFVVAQAKPLKNEWIIIEKALNQ